ncbi:ABC-type branched-subunit amino acid transport system substrate-binding protein [Altererythrobacter atlanticus]|uniref:Penicillin-binding protein activator LpoA n=1 Tax=Croceibacterium atlanticum TaxID=1267766 RepID=A0A0F7KQV6_9SPHN|nr:penicillin-binding protein activator [Croceibacterium atlanticum]AKH41567.1 Penicillin-binding protein activator LpoA [Croceibacterium atlanticum]MBB5733029.1 ABC-type branched-subunit amino acid transport system substrate-binding protein [Croceibacterium atlanticum]
MLGSLKRGLVALTLAAGLAGCQVIPGGDGVQTGPAEPGETTGPSDTALPTDTTRHRIALLVPLSGSNADVGRSIANATTMALLDTDAQNLRITTYDTATNAQSAAARAIADGNRLILGPLLRQNVGPVLSQAKPADVPLITFSNDISVASSDVFVLGHVPEQSVARTVAYAHANGARNFAALIPNGEYGSRAADAFSAAVRRVGGRLVATESYDRGNTSIVSAAERLESKADFDAVLVADGARLSAMAAGALKEPGMVLPTILGTELWSGEASIANASAMRGALFAAVSDARYRQFLDSYKSRFGETPYRIATLGYDSVLLTLRVARDWEPGTQFPVRELLGTDGFLGLDGPFRFRGDGVGERAMEVRRIGNGTIDVVDPAPQRFD